MSRQLLIGLFASMLLVSTLAGCRREPAVDPALTDTSATILSTDATGGGALNAPPSTTNPDAISASAADVMRNPEQYSGRVVTITGSVDRVYSPRAFTIDSGITPGRDLLVLSRDNVAGVVEAGRTRNLLGGDQAIVTGRVVTLVVPDVEREIGWDLQREVEVEFERQPIVIIETVSATAGGGQGTTGGTTGT